MSTMELKMMDSTFSLEGKPKAMEMVRILVQGHETVASRVCFVGGEPDKSQYRRFRIAKENAGDDFSAMQEAALHGWRMPDKLDLQMTGYPAKTRCFSWNRNGRWFTNAICERRLESVAPLMSTPSIRMRPP